MNDENKQSSNFWTTLPGILTGIAAVITAVAGSAGLISAFNSNKPPTSPVPSISKTIDVYADSIKGTEYTNKEDKYLQIRFKADGKWLAIPEDNSNPNIPDNAKGYISAKGDPNFQSNDTPCSRFPLGALIVKRQDGKCLASGEEDSFDLAPKETVYFLMNDVPSLYKDNKGSLKVNVSISQN